MAETPVPTSGGSSSGGNAQGLVQKITGFFTGGSNNKWTKVIIISVFVVAFFGLSGTAVWGMGAYFLIHSIADPSGNFGTNGACADAFNPSAHPLYEVKEPIGDFDANWARTDEAKQYAINTLGIPESSMKNPGKPNVENMIRAEVVSQFNSLSNKHGTTVVDAQIAALSYQEHESAAFKMFDSSGKPSYTIEGSYAVTNIMSLSNDKFCVNGKDRDTACSGYWKNKRTAASYDTSYAIYLGVKEIMGVFSGTAISGEGQQRWKNAIGYTFLPSNPNCYWNGGKSYCRYTVARNAWDAYAAKETPYSCNTTFGTVDIKNLRSWYYNQGSDTSRGGGDWGNKHPYCAWGNGWTQPHQFADVGCGVTSMAMLARYYGKNLNPMQFGEELCRVNDGVGLGSGNLSGAASIFGMKAVSISNPGSLSSITNNLSRGPLLAYGTKIFGSSGNHFVVIAGYDGSQLILNDPSRGSDRHVSTDSVGNISNLWYFTKK